MKKSSFFFTLLLFISTVYPQFSNFPPQDEGRIAGGLGLNWIDGELYYTFHFTPEISFVNFGVGLDLNLDFNSKGELREENFNETSDYLSLIRYIRYGLKNDPVFIKVGALDYYTLGHGSIMYRYNNSPSFDSRRIGLNLDIDFGKFGFESIYSTFSETGVVGGRVYVRPLQYTNLAPIPIIGSLEVGATFVGDFNKNAGVVSGFYDTSTSKFVVQKDVGTMSAFGFDIGLPLVSVPVAELTLYADYSKLIDFGDGVATGLLFEFNTLGLLSGSVKLERRFNNGAYIPAYFNTFYELQRFNVDSTNQTFTSKAQTLAATVDIGNGYYGELGISVLGIFDIIGSYQRLDEHPKSGILSLGTQIEPEGASIVLRASYDKINIQDEKDLFTLDNRSQLNFEFGYKPIQYILVSMLYKWNFFPVRDADDNIIGYEPQKRIEPRISFIVPFGI